MKYQLLSDKYYQARQRPGGFELISFNRQPVQSSAPWVGWTDNSDCCMNMNCPAWASSGLNCLPGSLATPVGPVKTFYKSLQQTDRQTDRKTDRQSTCFDLLCLTCPLNNGSLPHLSPLPPQSQGLTLLARPYREEIEFLSRRDNRSKLVAASL